MNIPDSLPPFPSKRIACRVSKKAERRLRQGHPWVYDQAIIKQNLDGRAGDLAVIFDEKRKFLAIGLYDPQSPIRVKILHAHTPLKIDADWFYERLSAALEKRLPLIEEGTTGYRMVYGEGDGLPGLIVDRYGTVLVLKLYSAAWFPYLRIVAGALAELTDAAAGILRLSRLLQKEGRTLGVPDGHRLWGQLAETSISFTENHLRFEADVIHGHKTGFFFDHRDNRQQVGRLAEGKNVLDLFAYSGGFSAYAAAGGAASVTSIDISRPALDAAAGNVQLNLKPNRAKTFKHETLCGDIFELLPEMVGEKRTFDLIVVDPPAFAKSQQEIPGALKAYTRLTHLVLDLLAPQGILVFASCSAESGRTGFFGPFWMRQMPTAGLYGCKGRAVTALTIRHWSLFRKGST